MQRHPSRPNVALRLFLSIPQNGCCRRAKSQRRNCPSLEKTRIHLPPSAPRVSRPSPHSSFVILTVVGAVAWYQCDGRSVNDAPRCSRRSLEGVTAASCPRDDGVVVVANTLPSRVLDRQNHPRHTESGGPYAGERQRNRHGEKITSSCPNEPSWGWWPHESPRRELRSQNLVGVPIMHRSVPVSDAP